MKKCPYCAEEIQDEAVKCKHCGEFLVKAPPLLKAPWYYSNKAWVIGFLCVGPLVLPLVWMNPRLGVVTKIVLTVVMLLLTWVLIWVLTRLILHSLALLEQLNSTLQ